MSWVFPSKVMTKVPVIAFLYDVPATATSLAIFFSTVCRLQIAYFIGVWCRFNTIGLGIWYFSMVETIMCRKTTSASFLALSGISTLKVVAALLTSPMRWNKLWIHHLPSKSTDTGSGLPLRFTRVLATDLATTSFTSPPFFLKDNKNL